MKHYQIEKNNMYKKMLLFFANPLHAAIWATFKRLKDEIANFVLLTTQLEKYIQQHQLDVTGLTASKNSAFTAMVKLTIKKAKKAYVWAVDTANENLEQIFDVEKYDFLKGAESKAYTKVKNIRDELSANIASMESVGLLPADLTELNASIKAYENTIGTPDAAKSHKTEGTMALDEMFVPIDKSLVLIEKLIDSEYSESHADIVKEFWVNHNIDKLPTHHSGVIANITDATTGNALQGSVLAVNGKTATSDMEGTAEISKIKPGKYMAKISLANYATQEVKVEIKRGRILEIDVKLAK